MTANSKVKPSLFESLESRLLFSTIPAPAGTGLTGEYFIGDFQTPVVVRSDARVNFNWAGFTPDQDIPSGVFSASWTGQVEAPTSGVYTFNTVSNAATRITVNGVVLFDNVTGITPTEKLNKLAVGTISLTAGQQYNIKLDFVSRGASDSRVALEWTKPGINTRSVIPRADLFPDPSVALPTSALVGTYFSGLKFNKQVMTRADSSIDFDWNPASSPDPVIAPGNQFSVQWVGQIIAPTTGTYTFETISDDGVRLTVNGDEIINDYHDHSAKDDLGKINLVAGQVYEVQMDYFEDVVDATAKLLWVPPGGKRSFVTFSASPVPVAPVNVAATAVSMSEIDLTWNDVPKETGFIVEQSTDVGNTFSQIATTSKGVTSFDNNGLSLNTTYDYEIIATDTAGNSTPSTPVTATTYPAVPVAPVASATAIGTTVTISWNAVPYASSYDVYRTANPSTGWTLLSTTSGTSATDTTVSNASTYYYEVAASNVSGLGPTSNVVSITTPPAAPGGLTPGVISPTQINLAWNDVTGETGFIVQESANGTTGWTQAGATGAGVTFFQTTGLSPSTKYFFRVLAVGSGGDSVPSLVANATTTVANPSYSTLTTFYGLTGNGTAYSINTSTGAVTQIGTLSFGTNAAGRDSYSSEFFYISTSTSSIDISEWNPFDDANTVVATSVPVSNDVGEAGFAADGTLFFTTAVGDLYAFNDDTNVTTLKGNIHVNGSTLITNNGDLAFAPSGAMYVETNSELYSIPRSSIDAGNGSGSIITATPIGPTGTGNLQIAFGQNGVLFGTDAAGQLYSLNQSTGAATPIGSPSGVNMGDLASVPLYSELTVSQSASTFVRGTNGSYTMTVNNAGPNTNVGAITVVDTLPAGVTYVSGTGTGWTFSISGQTVTMTYIANVVPGGSTPAATINVSIGSGVASSITNPVTVSSSIFQTNTSENSSSLTTPVTG